MSIYWRRVTRLNIWYFSIVFSSMFTSCITMSPMFGRFSVDRPWCDLLNEKAFLWCSPKHLGSQALIHLIDRGESLIRAVILTWSGEVLLQKNFVDWHHEPVAIWICKAVSSVRVDRLYYIGFFSLRLEFDFGLMHHNMGRFTAKTRSCFLKIHLLILVEGFYDSSLVELDLLLSLESFIIQSFQL